MSASSDLTAARETANAAYFLALVAMELVPFGAVIVDSEQTIVQVNKATEDLFDYHRAELIGKRLDMLMPEEHRVAHTDHWERFRRDPRPRFMGQGMKLPGRRKDGKEFPVEIQIAAERTAQGWFGFAFIRSLEQFPTQGKGRDDVK